MSSLIKEEKMINNDLYGIIWTHMKNVEVFKKSNNELIGVYTEKECGVLAIEIENQSHAPNYFGES